MPSVFGLGHDGCRAEERSHVYVMSAGVHHRDVAAVVIFRANLARVRKSGLLFHGQCVEFGAQHHGWPSAVLHDSHDAGAADMLRHFVTKLTQAIGQSCRGLRLMPGKLGMLMQVQIPGLSLGKDRLDLALELTALPGSRSRKNREPYRSDHAGNDSRETKCRQG